MSENFYLVTKVDCWYLDIDLVCGCDNLQNLLLLWVFAHWIRTCDSGIFGPASSTSPVYTVQLLQTVFPMACMLRSRILFVLHVSWTSIKHAKLTCMYLAFETFKLIFRMNGLGHKTRRNSVNPTLLAVALQNPNLNIYDASQGIIIFHYYKNITSYLQQTISEIYEVYAYTQKSICRSKVPGC